MRLQGRSYWGVGGTGGPWPSTSISKPNKVCVSFRHQASYFLWVFRNYTEQKFHNYYRVCFKFWTIYGNFSFFELHRRKRSLYVGPDEKVRYLTLELLKSFLLWTIQKKITMNEGLDIRI